jgi:hypothetical protein
MVGYKAVQMMPADPLGLGGMVNVGDTVDAGNVSITPLAD